MNPSREEACLDAPVEGSRAHHADTPVRPTRRQRHAVNGHSVRAAVAVLVSATLLASLVAVTSAGPASAAKPKCFGRAATKVGTARGELLRGTAKADVIVARGGHDTIIGLGGNDIVCSGKGNDKLIGGPGNDLMIGQLGNDKLIGGPGTDRLLGGPGNDTFDGGTGVDLCAQGTGIGSRVNCERPPVVVAPPPPAPAPPAPPPAIDLTNVLGIAYTDLNQNHKPDAGDVMIAQLVDTNLDGWPTSGDTVVMGKYPTKPLPVWPADFADWGVKSHVTWKVDLWHPPGDPPEIDAYSSAGDHIFYRGSESEYFDEGQDWTAGTLPRNYFQDWFISERADQILVRSNIPSQPGKLIDPVSERSSSADDYFIDVWIKDVWTT